MARNNCYALTKADMNGRKAQELVGESIVKGIEPRINVEHALHVLEIIEAARKSQRRA